MIVGRTGGSSTAMEAEFREIDEPGSWNAIYQVASKKVFLGKGRRTFYKLCVSFWLITNLPYILNRNVLLFPSLLLIYIIVGTIDNMP